MKLSQYQRGDWVRCRCENTCDFRGVVVKTTTHTRSDHIIDVSGWESTDTWYFDQHLERVEPYTPTDDDKLKVMKKITAGELTL